MNELMDEVVIEVQVLGRPMTIREHADTLDRCGEIMETASLDSVIAFFVATAEIAAHTYLGMPR